MNDVTTREGCLAEYKTAELPDWGTTIIVDDPYKFMPIWMPRVHDWVLAAGNGIMIVDEEDIAEFPELDGIHIVELGLNEEDDSVKSWTCYTEQSWVESLVFLNKQYQCYL